jgi:hypothetical protein
MKANGSDFTWTDEAIAALRQELGEVFTRRAAAS